MTFEIILALSAFLISLVGTRLTIVALRKRTVLMDFPSLRSNHAAPVPRGGGVPVVFALVICLLLADVSYVVVLGIFLLAAVSLLDDIIGVPIWVRLLVQILAVGLVLSIWKVPVIGHGLPLWLDKLILAVLWMWFTNLFNFMDGIDGISAAEMVAIGAGLCFVTVMAGAFPHTLFSYGVIIAAAGAGFLWWNWHPAKIFLGDVGSIPIGFMLGYVLLVAAAKGFVWPAVILPAYYVLDSTITITKRLLQGKKIWLAHSEHYYQQAVRAGIPHGTVAQYIFGVNILLIFLAVRAVIDPDLAAFHACVAYVVSLLLIFFFARAKPQ